MPVFRYDHHGGDASPRPKRGDTVVSARVVYDVVDVRPIESRLWHDRWRVALKRRCTRTDWDGSIGGAVHYVYCYAPGERPTDRRCGRPACCRDVAEVSTQERAT